jgi:hypothetical protein
MPTLCDVNMLLALCYDGHAQHRSAMDWLGEVTTLAHVIVCRNTQLGLLRLINNPAVMLADVRDTRAAWRVYDAMMTDDRFSFLGEPSRLDDVLRTLTTAQNFSPKLWADAYLAAFAISANLDLVTFDQAFKQFKNLRVTILKSE